VEEGEKEEPTRAGTGSAADELAREVYWAAMPMADQRVGSIQAGGWSDLSVGWSELESTMRRDHGAGPLPDDPVLEMGSPAKRRFKRFIFRVARPLMRRYDRVTADLALLGLETSQELALARSDTVALTSEVQRLRAELREAQATWDELSTEFASRLHEHDVRVGTATADLEALTRRLAAGAPAATGPAPTAPAGSTAPAPASPMPDAFYWRFEAALRGSPESIQAKLAQYRGFATELREQSGDSPLWLDLGCGEGQFLSMLRDWGWRVLGMDISPQAVNACREHGFDAVEGSLPDFLASYDGEAPHGMSAIQVVEHLDPATWLPLLQLARTVLAPGGALLIETIYPLNVDALTNWFFGDITHTWPANPETVRVMAGFAGFDRVEVRLMNDDAEGRPQDYALIARTA
jgi:SAM-dependent methyltransferase